MNLLQAIVNIVNTAEVSVKDVAGSRNRMNARGEGLELFIQDAFAGTLNETSDEEKINKYDKVFSYKGSASRPPDLMLKGGDAIEVKKRETPFSELQLNSSYPKAKMLASSPLIKKACRVCEEWVEKDIIYTIGIMPNGDELNSLWFVYGSIYAAEAEVYTSVRDAISDGINNGNSGMSFSPTREVGRINGVDPLKISNMRIRGMWLIQPPARVFDYVYKHDILANFELVAIIPLEKYMSFPDLDRVLIETEATNNENLEIRDAKVKNPDNPIRLIDVKLIVFKK